MWIFGYGSLIWKVDFPYEEKLTGYVKGFSRRFWQGSEDHRGLPGKPGRVVTLIPSSDTDEKVWGVAYRIHEKNVMKVKSHLDYREKDGYKTISTIFYPSDENYEQFEIMIYVADETNPYFLGPASLDDIAKQILQAEGPSGRNEDYLFQLAQHIRDLSPNADDSHLFQLESIALSLKKYQDRV